MIPEIRTILYATDLGDHAPSVFRCAVSLAQRYKAKIVLVHALEPLTSTGESLVRNVVPEETLQSIKREGVARVRQQIQRRLERFCQEELDQGAKQARELTEIRVLPGVPAHVILEQADEVGADVIVMGTHGYSGVARAFLGSVATKVLHHSRVPVYVVPLRQE